MYLSHFSFSEVSQRISLRELQRILNKKKQMKNLSKRVYIWSFLRGVLRKTKQIFKSRFRTPATSNMKIFEKSVNSWEPFRCYINFGGRDCGVYSSSIDSANRHRRGANCPITMSNNDLEEDDNSFTAFCDNPMEDDSAPIISILE